MFKKLFFSLLLTSILGASLRAQHYKLVDAGTDYFFEIEDDGEIIGLHVDSGIEDADGTSVSYLNEGFLRRRDGVFLGKIPTILGNEIHHYKNGDVLIVHNKKSDFSPTDSLLLKTRAPFGTTWRDAYGNYGEVTSVKLAKINGIKDTVKTIKMSNGFTISISRSNGVQKILNTLAPEASPIKKAKRTHEAQLSFRDVFNFEVGDIFHYSDRVSYPPGGVLPYEEYLLFQVDTLLHKQVSADGQTVAYIWASHKIEHYKYRDSVNVQKSSDEVETSHSYSLDPVFSYLPGEMGPRASNQQPSLNMENEYYLLKKKSKADCDYLEAHYSLVKEGWRNHRLSYRAGNGMETYSWSEHMGSYPGEKGALLPIYSKRVDGAECGTPLDEFTSSKAPLANKVAIYPNPFHTTVRIEGLQIGAYNLALYDAMGNQLWLRSGETTGVVQCADLMVPKGWYIIHVEQDHTSTHQQLWKY